MSERKTIFVPAKHKKYADIISLVDVPSARESVKELKKEFNEAETRAKQVRIKRVTVNASNRAKASAKRKRLSYKERLELNEIGRIYSRAYHTMLIPSEHARKG